MAKKKTKDERFGVLLKLDPDTLERLDAFIQDKRNAHPMYKFSRTNVILVAIQRLLKSENK